MTSESANAIAHPRKDRAIVFVHGFTSSAATCWGQLLDLLRKDREVLESFDLECIEYTTPLMKFSFTEQVPSLKDVAGRLRGELRSDRFDRYREITLVGHSQGGLVIQYYLVNMLGEGLGSDLKRIRQAILFATPNLGSDILSPLRKLMGYFPFVNRQERMLRVLDEEIAELRLKMLKKVVAASYHGTHCAPIPVKCFAGTEDGIVPRASAFGHFVNVQEIRGNHNSIKSPDDHGDERYRAFKELLFNPAGHLHIFEVDKFEVDIVVKPLNGEKKIQVRHGNRERTVETDNEARLVRRVTFSKNNECRNLFEIRYTTRKDGFVEPHSSHNNEAPPNQQTLWLDYGNTVTFQVRPVDRGPYSVDLKLYKAFDGGHRDVHFHLGGGSNIKKYRCRLDLRAYVSAGYRIAAPPQLYFDPDEPADHLSCDNRVLENPEPYKVCDSSGVWEWELENVRFGLVDIRWDVAKD